MALVPHELDRLNQLGGVEVKDVDSLGVIAEMLMVPSEAEDIVNAERSGSKDITLDADAVSVSSYHLQYGLQPHLFDADARGQTTQAHHRSLVVGDVYGIHVVLDEVCLLLHHLTVGTTGRTTF